MSCDFRSFLRLLILVSLSCTLLSASPDAFAFQEQEAGELAEEIVEQSQPQVEKKAEESKAEQSSSAETADAGTESRVVHEDSQGVEKEQEDPVELDATDPKNETLPVAVESSDVSDEITEEASDEETKDEETGMVLPSSGEKEMLTPKGIQWIWNVLFLFLTICFLGWLLSLMTAKPEEDTVESTSTDSDSDSNSNAAAKDLDFGKVYAARPSTVDDLTKIGGIDSAAEKRLNDAGIWQYDQLRKMTAQQRANLQRKLNLPRIRWYSLSGLGSGSSTDSDGTTGIGGVSKASGVAATAAGVAAAGAAATASLASNAKDQAVVSGSNGASNATVKGSDGSLSRVDSELGNVYVRPPKFRDDLTKLDGVDAQTAATMNEAGIYSFKQIESLAPVQRLAFEKRFGVSVAKMNLSAAQTSAVTTGQGNPKAGQGGSGANSERASSSTSVNSSKTSGDVAASGASTSTGTSSGGKASPKTVSGFAAANAKSDNEPSEKGAKPSKSPHSDSNGIGKTAAAVAGAAAAGVAGVAGASARKSRPDGSDSGSVTASASASISVADLVSTGKGRVDDQLGFVYASAPADADDLTKLVGINADAAKRLNAVGIYKFDQLSQLDEAQTAALARRFRLPEADYSDWRRCFYAWGRGIETTAEADEVYGRGMLHGIELPQIANGVFDGDKLVAYPEQTIFRGSNPEGWGKGNFDGIEGVETSLACDSIRSDINYLRIRRTDTRESVVVPMTKGNIFSNGGDNQNGWNGSSEVFFGGRHIGAFAQHLPQEVETKFSQGGWGFGHRYDHNDRQEWGWGGRVIEPTTFEVSVGCVGDVPGTVVFRSSDPSIWNTRTRDGESRFADPVETVSHPVNFVRIMREATGEAVIVRVDGNHILDEGFDPRCGWNGSGSEFSGGMHLGAYHSDLPQDFETRFEFGGWGFGHPYNDNDRQAWGWGGRQLPETIFEISLLESVPQFMQHELVE